MADILFTSDRAGKTDIYVSNDDGSGVRRLTDTPYPVGSPKWSPDGRQIAFMMDIETDPQKWQQYDIFIMNADGSQQRNLTEHPQQDGFPAFSPDGKYIVFDSSRSAGTVLSIFVMEIATRKVRKLTNDEFASSPNWSPDAQQIVYECIRRGEGRQIYIMDADGRRERLLLRRPQHGVFGGVLLSYDPRWSPDGKHVLYMDTELVHGKGRVANSIRIVNTNTRHIEVLDTPQKWRIEGACWADDGDAVLFTAIPNGLVHTSGTFNIYKYHLRHGQITPVINHPSNNSVTHWTPQNSRSVSARERIATQWARLKTDGI
jgi:Tol biopolymer transport system component